MPKFIHVRNFVEIEGTPFLMPNPCGGTTIAYSHDPSSGVVAYAYSRCHNKDHYNKKLGRAKSAGRLRSPKLRKEFTLDNRVPSVIEQVISRVQASIGIDPEEFRDND